MKCKILALNHNTKSNGFLGKMGYLGGPVGVGAMAAASISLTNPADPPLVTNYGQDQSFTFHDALDTNWHASSNLWPDSNSDLQPDNVHINDSILNIDVVKESSTIGGRTYDFSGGELQSTDRYYDGIFNFNIKNGAEPGTVGSAFLISPYQDANWHQQEIDIEFLGDKPNGVQLNLHSILHNPDGVINQTNNEYQHFVELPFDTRSEFHDYAIQLDSFKKDIIFFVDNHEIYRIENSPYFPDQALQIRLNHWVPNWAPEIDRDHFSEASMEYRNVTVTPLQTSINAAEFIGNTIGFSSLFTFAGSFLGPFIGAFVIKPIINVFKWIGCKILGKKFEPIKIFSKMSPRVTAITCAISGIILGMIKGGIAGAIFGPLGIVAGVFIGGLILGFVGFIGGYFGAKLFGLIANLINKYRREKTEKKIVYEDDYIKDIQDLKDLPSEELTQKVSKP